MRAKRDIDRAENMKEFRDALREIIKRSGLSSEQMRKIFVSIVGEDQVIIEHAGYTPEQCGRDK